MKSRKTIRAFAAVGAVASMLAMPAFAQNIELKIGYMKHPYQDASMAALETAAEKRGITIKKIPMAYSVFLEKVTTTLTNEGDQFDIIWHNDDWGQLWKKWLLPTNDILGMDDVDNMVLDCCFLNDEGKPTAVPMVHTLGALAYRTDLVSEDEVPETWDELVAVSKRLQEEDKVKWGLVGGMSLNHTWGSIFWTLWANGCDIFKPHYSRDNVVLAAAGWETTMTDECHHQAVEFWWDAMHEHKISPPGMTAYSRDDANAIFMAGDAAFTFVDTTNMSRFADPNKSLVAGNVQWAPAPNGPMFEGEGHFSWNAVWAWAIPKGVPHERADAAKLLLGDMLKDVDSQVAMWNDFDAPPPSQAAWDALDAADPTFAHIKDVTLDQELIVAPSYYFPQWPAVMKGYVDIATEALNGERADISATLNAGAAELQAIANK